VKDKHVANHDSAASRPLLAAPTPLMKRVLAWFRGASLDARRCDASPTPVRSAEPAAGRAAQLASLAGDCWRVAGHASASLARARLRRDDRRAHDARVRLEEAAGAARDGLAELAGLREANLMSASCAQPIEALFLVVIESHQPHPISAITGESAGPHRIQPPAAPRMGTRTRG
jgi:hypothetical protein